MRMALSERPALAEPASEGPRAAGPAASEAQPNLLRAQRDGRPPASQQSSAALASLAALRSYRGLAAALAVVAIGLAAWVGVLLAAGGGDGDLLTYSYRGRGGETTLLIQTVIGEGPATVTAAGLTHLDDGEAYHLWAIRDEHWSRVGVFNTSAEGRWHGDFDFRFGRGDEVAVTIGSASGADSQAPREPLFRSPI